MKKVAPFATEIALCSAFIDNIDKRVWTPYAETAGWDILLSRKVDGFQIGIEAKLSLNVEVVNQAIEEYGGWGATHEGPDCRAVLVPDGGTGRLGRICDYLGLVIITVKAPYPRGVYGSIVNPSLPAKPDQWAGDRDWPEWAPAKRHPLPEYVPDVAAGSSAPVQLTDWKIKAIKLAVILETRGFVRREDFAHLRLDHRRWIANEWLRLGKEGYVVGAMPDLRKQHPKVYEKIKVDAPKWMKSETKGLL